MCCKTKDKLSAAEKKPSRVRYVDNDKTDNDEYTFSVNDFESVSNKILLNIGGIPVQVMIDSGSSCNIIDMKLWEELKSKIIKCDSKKCNKKLYAYGSKEPPDVPLNVLQLRFLLSLIKSRKLNFLL